MKISNFYTLILFSVIAFIYLQIVPSGDEFDSLDNKIKNIFLILLNVFAILKYKRFNVFLIFCIFLLNYLFTLSIPAFYPYTRISGITTFYNGELYSEILDFFVAFYIVLFGTCFFNFRSKSYVFLSDKIDKYGENKHNQWVVFVSIIAYCSFLFLGRMGRQSSEALINLPFEYAFIFIFLIKIYSKDTKNIKFLLHILLIAAMVKTLIFAGRVELIEAAVILYIFYYEKKIGYYLIILLSIIGTLLFEWISITRNILINGYFDISTSRLFFDRLNPPALLLSNEGDVIYAGMSMIGIVNENIVSFQERIYSFISFFVSQIIPIGHLFSNANLAYYLQDFTATLGGGMIFAQFYFWLGNFGVVLSGVLVYLVFHIAYRTKSGVISFLAVCTIGLFPRWYVYFPDYLIKFPILYFYGLTFFYFINILTRRNRQNGLR